MTIDQDRCRSATHSLQQSHVDNIPSPFPPRQTPVAARYGLFMPCPSVQASRPRSASLAAFWRCPVLFGVSNHECQIGIAICCSEPPKVDQTRALKSFRVHHEVRHAGITMANNHIGVLGIFRPNATFRLLSD